VWCVCVQGHLAEGREVVWGGHSGGACAGARDAGAAAPAPARPPPATATASAVLLVLLTAPESSWACTRVSGEVPVGDLPASSTSAWHRAAQGRSSRRRALPVAARPPLGAPLGAPRAGGPFMLLPVGREQEQLGEGCWLTVCWGVWGPGDGLSGPGAHSGTRLCSPHHRCRPTPPPASGRAQHWQRHWHAGAGAGGATRLHLLPGSEDASDAFGAHKAKLFFHTLDSASGTRDGVPHLGAGKGCRKHVLRLWVHPGGPKCLRSPSGVLELWQ